MKVRGGVQPYAAGKARQPGQALSNMLRGRTIANLNTSDTQSMNITPKSKLGRKPRTKRRVRVPRAFR